MSDGNRKTRVSRRKLLRGGLGAAAVAATFFLPAGPTPLVYAIAAIAGIGFGSQWVFPWAMVPDVVDYDRLTSGEQRAMARARELGISGRRLVAAPSGGVIP